MTTEELEKYGKGMYGDRWQTNLARDLGIASRTVRNWATGAKVPPTKQQAIFRLIQEKAAQMAEWAKACKD